MIAALDGTVLERSTDSLILNVGGVGYLVTVTSGVLSRGSFVGDRLKLVVYTDMRENAIHLFGFQNAVEREVFLLLKKVKGVGSRTAVAIISAIGAEGLLVSIGSGDVRALQAIPGIGKKTAERLIVELREQVKTLAAPEVGPTRGLVPPAASTDLPSVAADAILALEKLGFPADRAKQAVASTLKDRVGEHPAISDDAGELLRVALGHI